MQVVRESRASVQGALRRSSFAGTHSSSNLDRQVWGCGYSQADRRGKAGLLPPEKKKAERDFEVFACRPLKGPVHVPWPAKGRVSYLSKA